MSRTAPLPSFLVFSGMPQGAAFNIAARAIDGRAAIGTWFELLAHVWSFKNGGRPCASQSVGALTAR